MLEPCVMLVDDASRVRDVSTEHGMVLDPVVDRVKRTDRLGCFVDLLDRLHR